MVSVIVPSYNSYSTVARTLASLFEQNPVHLKEILVVDSSDDGRTPAALEEARNGKLKVHRLASRAIPAAARNAGAKLATGEILAFIDSDAYAAPDWLDKITALFKGGARVGGGAILLPPEQRDRPLALAQYFLQFSEFMGPDARALDFVPSCNMYCERRLFEEVGGFPDIRAAEDVLFGRRVAGKAAFQFDPRIRVYHIFTQTWKRYRTNQTLLGEYTLRYRRLAPTPWLYRGLAPLLLLPAFAPVKFWRMMRRVRACGDAGLQKAFFRQLPLILAGLFFLSAGFARACFRWKS